MSKVCTKCKEEKGLSEFHRRNSTKDGRGWWCKSCCKQYHDKYAKKNRERINARTREWYRKNEQGSLKHHLMKSYNLSLDEYHHLYQAQNKKCAICSIDIFLYTKKNGRNSACVDHCHETGKVRGLLCNHCNRALGFVNDDIKILSRMKEYLSGQPYPQ